MCYKLFECVTVWDFVSLIFGIVMSALITIYIIRFFRPRICIGIPRKTGSIIKITVKNKCKRFAAANLRIEATAVLNDKTYHLDFDRYDFIMLSRMNNRNEETPFERTYRAHDVDNYTKKIATYCQNMNDFFDLLNNNQSYLRIRVHAYHEFTGFGKAFEAQFYLKKEVFVPKNNINVCIK